MSENLKNGEPDNDPCQDVIMGKTADNDCRQVTGQEKEKGSRLFSQTIFYDWCKACGICIAFCPQQVFSTNEQGKPVVAQPDACVGCGFCEIHCPDFAITIAECQSGAEQHRGNS
jgi:2-oxoglutarate ferredoxin oxidoreductase subunit delta